MALSAAEIQDQERSEVPSATLTNTAMGNLINKCCATNQKINIPAFTTLNEVYSVLAQESLGAKNGRDFELKYFGVGVRGSNCVGMDGRGVSRMRVNQHQPSDGNLFTPIPLAARPIDNDFDNLTRAKYRMRFIESYNGIQYAFYFLKLINFDSYDPKNLKITKDETTGSENVEPHVPVSDDLRPEPVELTSTGSVPVSNVYLTSSGIMDCTLNETDIAEIKNACKIMFGDANYASINEIGIAWGIDTETDGLIGSNGANAQIRYTEAMSAVFAHFISEKDARSVMNNRTIPLAFDHISSEPMLLHTVSTASPANQGMGS